MALRFSSSSSSAPPFATGPITCLLDSLPAVDIPEKYMTENPGWSGLEASVDLPVVTVLELLPSSKRPRGSEQAYRHPWRGQILSKVGLVTGGVNESPGPVQLGTVWVGTGTI
jgi:hypothetical protein